MTRPLLFSLSFIFLYSIHSCHGLSSSPASTSPSGSASSTVGAKEPKTTIAVCTGPDCRVDGASDCLRRLQQTVAAKEDLKSTIRVTGRACLGPCGDGPCVMITDANNNKMIEAQPSKIQISLVEPDIFASNPKGWYQVRTDQQVEEVMEFAARAAGVEHYAKGESASSSNTVYVTSSRAWFDRPRNERKVLQRLVQVMVLYGLYSWDGDIGNLQYSLAFGLWVLADFIMKENIFTLIKQQVLKIK